MTVDMNKQGCKVFIGGLSWDTTEVRLRAYFENYGTVKECFVSYDKSSGKPRGFGFVVFESPSVADRVVQHRHTIDRREVDAKHAMPRQDGHPPRVTLPSPSDEGSSSSSAPRKVFVGGLPPTVHDGNLRQHFERIGAVEDAVVMMDHHSKRSRGFGFVTFKDEVAVANVMRMESRPIIHGKPVEVKRALPREQLQAEPSHHRRRPPHVHNGVYPNQNVGYHFQEAYGPMPMAPRGRSVDDGAGASASAGVPPFFGDSGDGMVHHQHHPMMAPMWQAHFAQGRHPDAAQQPAYDDPGWADLAAGQASDPLRIADVGATRGVLPLQAYGMQQPLSAQQPIPMQGKPTRSSLQVAGDADRPAEPAGHSQDAFETLASSLGATLPLPGHYR